MQSCWINRYAGTVKFWFCTTAFTPTATVLLWPYNAGCKLIIHWKVFYQETNLNLMKNLLMLIVNEKKKAINLLINEYQVLLNWNLNNFKLVIAPFVMGLLKIWSIVERYAMNCKKLFSSLHSIDNNQQVNMGFG